MSPHSLVIEGEVEHVGTLLVIHHLLRVDKILEKQSGFLRLLVYLSDKKEKTITEILDETDIPVHQLYASIEKAKELGLVKTRVDKGKYPPRNVVTITKKGMEISKRIDEIKKMLS